MNSLSIITNAIEVDESFPSVPLLPNGFSFQHISKSSKDVQIISEIKIKSILGKRCFSYIYECEVGNSDGSKKNIAVKIAEERCNNLQNEGRIYNEYLIGRKLRNFFGSSHISLMNLVSYGNFCHNNMNFGYIVMDIYKYNMNDVKKLFVNNFQSDEYKLSIINVCLTLCSALKYLSIHNLVHSDIKSDNILCKKLSTDPSLVQNVVLADYGLTNLSGSPCRTSRYFLGPLSYAHIDLLDNIKSLRSDSYMLAFYIMDLFDFLPELKQIDGIESARQKKTSFLNDEKNLLVKSKKDSRLINMFIDVFAYLSKLNIKDCPNYDTISDIFLKYLPSFKSTLTKYDCLEVKKPVNIETKFQIFEISKEKSLIFKNNITIFGNDIDIIKLKNIYKDLSKFDMIACIKAFIQYSNRGFVSVYKYNDEAKKLKNNILSQAITKMLSPNIKRKNAVLKGIIYLLNFFNREYTTLQNILVIIDDSEVILALEKIQKNEKTGSTYENELIECISDKKITFLYTDDNSNPIVAKTTKMVSDLQWK